MCDPITITGIALSAASVVGNTVAQSKVAKARNNALAAERIRQRTLDREAAAVNAGAQDRYTDFGGKQADRAGVLGDFFAGQNIEQGDANTVATLEQNTAPTSSNLTIREEEKQRGKAREFTDRQGKALGDLRSFGDVLGNILLDQGKDGSIIGQIGGFKRGSSGVLPLELEAANQAGNGFKLFADLAGLGGSVVTGAGLSKGNAFPSAPSAPGNAYPWAGLTKVTAGGANPYNPYAYKPGLH